MSDNETRFIYHVQDHNGYHALIAADGLTNLGFPFLTTKIIGIGKVEPGLLMETDNPYFNQEAAQFFLRTMVVLGDHNI